MNRIYVIFFYTLILVGCSSITDQGLNAYNSGNYDLAVAKMKAPAEAGDPTAQNTMGLIWLEGLGSTPKNFDNALTWFSKAAQNGEPYAMNNIGVMYENGYSVPKDIGKAVAWYTLAARRGIPIAQTNLAHLGIAAPPVDLAVQQESNSADNAALLLLLGVISVILSEPASHY